MAIYTDMGVLGNGILQPKQKHKWRVSFNGMGVEDALTVQAVTVDRPKLSFEPVTLDRYNSRAYIAGKHEFEPISITFEDDFGSAVTTAIQQQLERQQQIIGLGAAPGLPSASSASQFKFGIVMSMLDGSLDGIIEQWGIEGAWIMNMDWGDLDYANGEAMRLTMQVRYDHARQNPVGAGRENAHGGPSPV